MPQRTVETRDFKHRQPLPQREWRRPENPFVDLPARFRKIVSHLHGKRELPFVAAVAPVRRIEARVQNGKLQKPARPQHAKRLFHHLRRLRDVHQAHAADREIKRRRLVGQLHRARVVIRDAERGALLFLARVADKDLRDVQPRHPRAALCDQPRVVPLAAADIKPLQPLDRRQHRHERRRVQVVAIGVVARARELRPSLGVAVPTISDREVIHGVMRKEC